MVTRIPSRRLQAYGPPAPPPPPPTPAQAAGLATGPVHRLWWWHRRYTAVGVRPKVRYELGRAVEYRPRQWEPVYEERWFRPGQRVRKGVIQLEYNGLGNLFLPILLFSVLTQQTAAHTVYQLAEGDLE